MKRPFFLYLLFILNIFLGICAFAGGGLLILKPDGSLLGMQSGWLEHSPFSNYLIPGLLLFVFLGLVPLFAVIGLLFKIPSLYASRLNIYSSMHWAWTFSLYAGIIAIIWITIQQILTQYFWIQSVIIIIGVLIIICTMMPSVIKKFELHEYK